MCGRFSLTTAIDQLLPRLQGPLPPHLAEHYAPRPLIRPGEPLLIQRQQQGELEVAFALWGLLPAWVKDPGGHRRPIHARAETLQEKASFRGPWRHHRCLLPADAFGEKGQRIRRLDGAPFWLAGLWERWIGADGTELETCCVITTAPNALLAPLHDRMPVVIPDGLEEPWLSAADGGERRALEPLLQPWEASHWCVEPWPASAKTARSPDSRLDQSQLELPW